jgi:glyceraldehyde-3-phosphate dehydrogenase (NAD(P))
MAYRVPTSAVSVVDLTVLAERATNVEEVNAAFQKAADDRESPLHGILAYEEEPLVSSDYKGHPASAIIDVTTNSHFRGCRARLLLTLVRTHA